MRNNGRYTYEQAYKLIIHDGNVEIVDWITEYRHGWQQSVNISVTIANSTCS